MSESQPAPGPAKGASEGLDPAQAEKLKAGAANDPVQDSERYLDAKAKAQSVEHQTRKELYPVDSIMLTEIHEMKTQLKQLMIMCLLCFGGILGLATILSHQSVKPV